MSEELDFADRIGDRHLEAYLSMTRDQLIHVAAKRYGDVSSLVDRDAEELAQFLAYGDLDDYENGNWVSSEDITGEQDRVLDLRTGHVHRE